MTVENRQNDVWVEKTVEYIKNLKKANGITLPKLAKMVDVSEDTIHGFLYGPTQNPRFFTTCEIIRVLGGSVDEILELKPKPPEPEKKPNANAEHLLKVKDEMLEGYKETINVLKDQNGHLRTQNKRLMWAFAVAVAAMFGLFVADFSVHDRGWIQREVARIIGTVSRA